ncbi:hypothetical protein [Kribbella sp.]|uniref:hypothetical protein n=1 Tax=Kribbella sp. TaxID=1871183 RepID=UPI002D37C603|nr:hypothetical protein [Kribbella sp.]HZX04741.1 hypothetical protein [Kribbella sp.]
MFSMSGSATIRVQSGSDRSTASAISRSRRRRYAVQQYVGELVQPGPRGVL